jgi:uncharacterized protein (UPF0303 family)
VSRALPNYTTSDLEPLLGVEFPHLDNDDAVSLGLVAVEVIREWDLELAVRIVLGDDIVFQAKLGGTGPGNDPWLAAKAATAVLFGEPSLLVKLRHLDAGAPFEQRDDIDHELYKAHGGAIPLRVDGQVVGTLTMSGQPDVIDHEAAAEAISRYLASVPS